MAALTDNTTNLNASETSRYLSVTAELERYLDTLAPPLQTQARLSFKQMTQGEFSRVAALLPYWLADLLPVQPDTSHRLGVAQLYLWWYYHIQDELLDHAAAPTVLLCGHLAFLKAIDTYDSLKLTGTSCRREFHRLTQVCAETTALEQHCSRFTSLNSLTSGRLNIFTLEFLEKKVATFYFTLIAHLHLARIPAGDSRHHDLPAALRSFATARQLADDAADWLVDLQAGRLNYISAALVRRLQKRGLTADDPDLDLDRLAGYQLTDETFWSDMERTADSLNNQALTHLTPYGDSRFRRLIRHQIDRHTEQWAAARTHRAQLRERFGLIAI